MIFPDCQSLSQDFTNLWNSNEKRIEKYTKNLDTFFGATTKQFHSKMGRLNELCRSEYIKAIKIHDDKFYRALKALGTDRASSLEDLKSI